MKLFTDSDYPETGCVLPYETGKAFRRKIKGNQPAFKVFLKISLTR